MGTFQSADRGMQAQAKLLNAESILKCHLAGVASNVVTYLAGADVPLSVLMTTTSTVTAIVATPTLVKILVNSIVPVNAAALVSSTFQVRFLTYSCQQIYSSLSRADSSVVKRICCPKDELLWMLNCEYNLNARV